MVLLLMGKRELLVFLVLMVHQHLWVVVPVPADAQIVGGFGHFFVFIFIIGINLIGRQFYDPIVGSRLDAASMPAELWQIARVHHHLRGHIYKRGVLINAAQFTVEVLTSFICKLVACVRPERISYDLRFGWRACQQGRSYFRIVAM